MCATVQLTFQFEVMLNFKQKLMASIRTISSDPRNFYFRPVWY